MSGFPEPSASDLDDIPLTPSDEDLLSCDELEEAVQSLCDDPELSSGTAPAGIAAYSELTVDDRAPFAQVSCNSDDLKDRSATIRTVPDEKDREPESLPATATDYPRRRLPPPSPNKHAAGFPSQYTCFKSGCNGSVIVDPSVELAHGDHAFCSDCDEKQGYCSVCNGFFQHTRVVRYEKDPTFKYARNSQHSLRHVPRRRAGGRQLVKTPPVRGAGRRFGGASSR